MSDDLKAIAEKASLPVEYIALSAKVHVLSAIIGSIAHSLKEVVATKRVSVVGVRMPQKIDQALFDPDQETE